MRPCFCAHWALVIISWLLAALPAAAQITILHSFSGGAGDGANPQGGSLLQVGSTLYGTTTAGGSAGQGTIFQIATDGSGYGVLHSFVGNEGNSPDAGLIRSGSTFYGMTSTGGSGGGGTIFQIGVDGTGFSPLYSFAATQHGPHPRGALTQVGSTLYGVTQFGGQSNNGTLFQIGTDGTGFGVSHTFNGNYADGAVPNGALLYSAPYFYGTTQGAALPGSVFRIAADGSGYARLYAFPTPTAAAYPCGTVVQAGDWLYGMTQMGGPFNGGTIFRVMTDGSGFQVLHAFGAGLTLDGDHPTADLLLVGPTLYGMTFEGGSNNGGTIFSMGIDGTNYSVLHSFTGGLTDGRQPWGDLTLAGSTLYGVTRLGGANDMGVIFSLPIAVPEPSVLFLTAGGALAVIASRVRRRHASSR